MYIQNGVGAWRRPQSSAMLTLPCSSYRGRGRHPACWWRWTRSVPGDWKGRDLSALLRDAQVVDRVVEILKEKPVETIKEVPVYVKVRLLHLPSIQRRCAHVSCASIPYSCWAGQAVPANKNSAQQQRLQLQQCSSIREKWWRICAPCQQNRSAWHRWRSGRLRHGRGAAWQCSSRYSRWHPFSYCTNFEHLDIITSRHNTNLNALPSSPSEHFGHSYNCLITLVIVVTAPDITLVPSLIVNLNFPVVIKVILHPYWRALAGRIRTTVCTGADELQRGPTATAVQHCLFVDAVCGPCILWAANHDAWPLLEGALKKSLLSGGHWGAIAVLLHLISIEGFGSFSVMDFLQRLAYLASNGSHRVLRVLTSALQLKLQLITLV